MLRLWRQFGDALDRSGLAGWVLLFCGFAIMAVTLLAPAWLDVQRLSAQVSVLERQEQLLEMRHTNYQAFVRAIERSDPMIMQRLAYHHLNLKPSGASPLDQNLAGVHSAQPIDRWMRPTLPPISDRTIAIAYPDTRLVRLVTGATRPWTLAFGGWLVLMGLMVNPGAGAGAAAGDDGNQNEEELEAETA